MARLPALVDALSLVDGRERVAIDNIARAVREAGFIQTTKRGRGAAEMTTQDAAALLVGLYGAGTMVDAPGTLKGFSQARRKAPAPLPEDAPAALGPLHRSRTLLDAVAQVIELAPYMDVGGGPDLPPTGACNVWLTLYRPHLHASIRALWTLAPDRLYEAEFTYTARARARIQPPYEIATEVRPPIFIILHRATAPSE